MFSRVFASVITLGVYQVARCGKQSVYFFYYCMCISSGKVWLAVSTSVITVDVYQVARCG